MKAQFARVEANQLEVVKLSCGSKGELLPFGLTSQGTKRLLEPGERAVVVEMVLEW